MEEDSEVIVVERTRKGRGEFKAPSIISQMRPVSQGCESPQTVETSDSLDNWEDLEQVLPITITKESQKRDIPMFQATTTSLEVSDFPATYRKEDILEIFGALDEIHLLRIKWINDTQAIVHFPSAAIAKKAYLLACDNPNAQITPCNTPIPFSDSSRPTTTDMVARRMIAGALGMRPKKKTIKEQQTDTEKLKEARGNSEFMKERQEQLKKERRDRDQKSQSIWDQ